MLCFELFGDRQRRKQKNLYSKNGGRVINPLHLAGLLVFTLISSLSYGFDPGSNSNFDFSLSDTSQIPTPLNDPFFVTKGSHSVNQGAFNYNIPIYLPPTTNNIAPNLSFHYSTSNSKYSHFGVGWQITGIGAISRCDATFATEGGQATKSNPRYSDGDRLCLNGRKLILKNGPKDASDATYWAPNAVYKTEVETFSKIVANSDHTAFTVYLKSGLIQTYGGGTASQKAIYYRPGYTSGTKNYIKRWALSKGEDRYGNDYTVDYNYDTNDYEHYIRGIFIDPNVRVTFAYIDKVYPRSGYDKGQKYVKRKLLEKIIVRKTTPEAAHYDTQNGNGTAGHIVNVREYRMNYWGSLGGNVVRRTTNERLPMLLSVTECGIDADDPQEGSVCGLPLEFSWSGPSEPFGVGTIQGSAKEYVDNYFDGVTEPRNGIYISTPNGWGQIVTTEVNDVNNPGSTVNQVSWKKVQIGVGVVSEEVLATVEEDDDVNLGVMDVNGDGLEDACIAGKVYLLNPQTYDFEKDLWPDFWCRFSRSSMDVNSDGLKDLVWFESGPADEYEDPRIVGKIKWASNPGDPNKPKSSNGYDANVYGFWGTTTRMDFETYTPHFSGPQLLGVESGGSGVLADLNGDGLKDVIYVDFNNVLAFRLNTGYGLTGARSTGISLEDGWGVSYDKDNDGIDEYIHIAVDHEEDIHTFYLFGSVFNENGNIEITGGGNGYSCPENNLEACNYLPRGGDINNDGLVDTRVGTTFKPARRGEGSMLSTITDGLGHRVVAHYSHLVSEPHTKYAHPPIVGYDWLGNDIYTPNQAVSPHKPVDRSMRVVSELSVSNGVGGTSSMFYYYSGGAVDKHGRGFLGFREITVAVDDGVNKNYTKTLYHQDFPLTGRVMKQTVGEHQVTNKKRERISAYEVHPNNPEFVYESNRFEQDYEFSDGGSPYYRGVGSSHTSFEYDEFGNLTNTHTTRGQGGTEISPNHYEVEIPLHHAATENSYDNNITDHLLGFRTYTRTNSWYEDGSNSRTSCQTFTAETGTLDVYLDFNNCDWHPFNGTVALQNVYIRNNKGVITQTQSTATDPETSYSTVTRTTTYENFEYDIYPRRIINNLGQATNLEYDQRHSAVSKTTDPNDFIATTVYDAWGRVAFATDENTQNQTFTEMSLCDSSCSENASHGAAYVISSRTTSYQSTPNEAPTVELLAAPVSKVFYDMLGRDVHSKTYMEGSIVKVDKEYNVAGQLWRVSEPYSGSTPTGWTVFDYDSNGRKWRTTRPDNTTLVNRIRWNAGERKITTLTENLTPNGIESTSKITYYNALGQVRRVEEELDNSIDYTYDAHGNLTTTVVNENTATTVTVSYDNLGNKTQIIDPDSGTIDFRYNGFGEQRFQYWGMSTAYKSMEFRYDGLGRKTTRIDRDPAGQAEWFYWEWDTELVGALTAAYSDSSQMGRFYKYNTKGQIQSIGPWREAYNPHFSYIYDDFGRVSEVTYPTGNITVERKYNAFGQHVKTKNKANQQAIWELGDQTDSRGNYTHQRYGNGIVTEHSFGGPNGSLTSIESGLGSAAYVQSHSYEFDSIGNLHSRQAHRVSVMGTVTDTYTENFTYDELYRLTNDGSQAVGNDCGNNYCYDALGNLTFKSGVGELDYAPTQANKAGVHAVTSGAGYNYTYDDYGNVVQRGGASIDYDVFNKPIQIGNTYFDYGADHEKLMQTSYDVNATTYYLTGAYGEKFEALVYHTGLQKFQSYVDGVQIYETNTYNSNVKVSYLHYDHLGSVEAITDASGSVVDHLSYNAWGERRADDWSAGDPTMGIFAYYDTQAGFTSHEMLDHLGGLIHMGGRVYDPLVSRFLSADLFIQAPYNSQSYNRYTYVFNNPLSATDPTGYFCEAGWCELNASVDWGNVNWDVIKDTVAEIRAYQRQLQYEKLGKELSDFMSDKDQVWARFKTSSGQFKSIQLKGPMAKNGFGGGAIGGAGMLGLAMIGPMLPSIVASSIHDLNSPKLLSMNDPKSLCGALCEISTTAESNPFLNGQPFNINDLASEVVPEGGGPYDNSNFTDDRNGLAYDVQYVQVGWSIAKTYGASSPDLALIVYMTAPAMLGDWSWFSSNNLGPNMRGLQLGEFGAARFGSFEEFVYDLCPLTCRAD